jgi:hypothetical protein
VRGPGAESHGRRACLGATRHGRRPQYLDYYLTFESRAQPDAYEQTLPEIFPDEAPGSFTHVPGMAGSGRWVWTTFYGYQWDLNYANPTVFREILAIMCFLANRSVDVLRLDAAPFLWKRLGTDCQNQPEVHLLIQVYRALLRVAAPAVIFKAEAIVPPDDLIRYIGVKTTVGKQCELAYNNQLMVNLRSGLATRKATLLAQAMHQAPRLLLGAAPVNYVRNHMGNELGLLNDPSYRQDPTKAHDSRWLHRPRMDWSKAARRHDRETVEARIFDGLRALIAVHGGASALPQLRAFSATLDGQRARARVRPPPPRRPSAGAGQSQRASAVPPGRSPAACRPIGWVDRPAGRWGGCRCQWRPYLAGTLRLKVTGKPRRSLTACALESLPASRGRAGMMPAGTINSVPLMRSSVLQGQSTGHVRIALRGAITTSECGCPAP